MIKRSLLAIVIFCFPIWAGANTLLVVGDSISSAYGLQLNQGWVHLLALRVKPLGYSVVNISLGGNTTNDALAGYPLALKRYRPSIVVLQLGGNDGLRGIAPQITYRNLAKMIEAGQAIGAKILLVGIRIPPNYGRPYVQRFEAVYPRLAKAYKIHLVAKPLKNIVLHSKLMQADGIHPKAIAQRLLLDNIWPKLRTLIQ